MNGAVVPISTSITQRAEIPGALCPCVLAEVAYKIGEGRS